MAESERATKAPQVIRPREGAAGGASVAEGAARADAEHRIRYRRLGARAAANRALSLLNGKELSPAKVALLKVTARLLIHLENSSNRLFELGEVKGDEEPRQLVARVQDLARQIKENLAAIFGDDDDSGPPDLARLMSRGQ